MKRFALAASAVVASVTLGAGLIETGVTATTEPAPAAPASDGTSAAVATGERATIVLSADNSELTAKRRAKKRRASRSSARRRSAPATDENFRRLAQCESGGNIKAVGGKGKYLGAFQMTRRSWSSVGMSGTPLDHDYGTQAHGARLLQARDGWGQWPHCSRKLGLR